MPFASVSAASRPGSTLALSAQLDELAAAAIATLAALDLAIDAGAHVSSEDVLAAADRVGELARGLDFASIVSRTD